MSSDNRKVVIVGAGQVGMSCAFSVMCRHSCDELVLIDDDPDKAFGEALDLNHGLAFSHTDMKIRAGNTDDCADADIVILSAGKTPKNGESRIELMKRNGDLFASVIDSILRSGFFGIFITATEPVDILARLTRELSGFEHRHVIGTGTVCETARLRYLLAEYFGVSAVDVTAYVIGEHGDSELIPWSQVSAASKPVFSLCESLGFNTDDLKKTGDDVKFAAQRIIETKNAAYYGTGMALARTVEAVFSDENSVMTVSACLDGEYGIQSIYAGVPSVINRHGVRHIIELDLTPEEKGLFGNSCKFLNEAYSALN